MIFLINVNVILICLLESVLYFSHSGSERLVGVGSSRLFQTGVPSNTKHPALLPARKEWRRNEPAADERDAGILKKIENKRTCICVQKKKSAPGPCLGAGGCSALRLTSQYGCKLIGQERLKFRWRMRP